MSKRLLGRCFGSRLDRVVVLAAWLGLAACGGPELEEDTAASVGETGSPDDTLSTDYCNCMLFSCHDHYHDLWGEDEMQARAACFEVADALARAGGSIETNSEGDSVECRLHYCRMSSGEDDPLVCPAALGASPCD